MSKYLLDTNICIHFFKNEHNISEKIREHGLLNCFVSEITIMELFFGVENSSKKYQSENLEKAETFEKTFESRILPISKCIRLYAKEKVRLRSLGKFPGEFDLVIGTTAVANEMVLVTRNTKHFQDIEGIVLENWVDE